MREMEYDKATHIALIRWSSVKEEKQTKPQHKTKVDANMRATGTPRRRANSAQPSGYLHAGGGRCIFSC